MPRPKKSQPNVIEFPAPTSKSEPAIEPLLIDIPAAARALSTTVWQVRDLLWSKKIPYIKLGRKFLIRPSALREFVEQQGKNGEEAA